MIFDSLLLRVLPRVMATTLLFGWLIATTSAQAVFQTFEHGCSYRNEDCRIGNRGLPRVGQTFAVTYTGPNEAQPTPRGRAFDVHPHLALGLTSVLPVPIPPSTLAMQPDGCALFIRVDALVATHRTLSAWPTSVFENSVEVPIPAMPALVGSVFFVQWVTMIRDSYTNRLAGIVTSDPAVAVVGS